jgi:two-component system sensor histidine kinase KdpD
MAAPSPFPAKARAAGAWRTAPEPRALLGAIAIVAAVTLIAQALSLAVNAASLTLLFLVAVLLAGARFGFWGGIVAPPLAFLAYNFFFVQPFYTLRVADGGDFLTLVVLLAAGATTGVLAGRLREQSDAHESRARALEQLGLFTQELAAASTIPEIDATIVRHLAAIDGGSAVLLRLTADGLNPSAAAPSSPRLSSQDLDAAERALRRNTDEEPAASGWADGAFAFRPLGGGQGVVGFSRAAPSPRFPEQHEQLRRTIIDQGRLALEKAGLARDAAAARADAEREAMRAALLSSLSHDLKTPLATILGSISSLRAFGDALPAAARTDLLAAAEEETERLSRYVSNLLHLTRLKAGIDLRLDWVDVGDVAHGAVARARRDHPGRDLRLATQAMRTLIRADAVLLEQALFNLIDNAAKYSPADSPVVIEIAEAPDAIRLSIIDDGPGIAVAARAEIFEPFFRDAQRGIAGTGLGLAIARGIVGAMGGTIDIESPRGPRGGTAMHVRLPVRRESAS